MRLIDQLRSLNNFRKALNWQTVRQVCGARLQFKVVDKPLGSRILVFSPHPDDDVFALGGTLLKHKKANDTIKVIYLTDGSRGTPERIRDKSLIEIRQKEAQAALAVLGIDDFTFWGYQDGKLVKNSTTYKAAYNILSDFQPEIIYLPHFLDNQPDHFETNRIVLAALFESIEGPIRTEKKLPNAWPHLRIWAYEVWSPIFINRLVDISKEIEKKKEAMKKHLSQLKCREYDKAMVALNEYRGKSMRVGDYAEGFFEAPADIYYYLFQTLQQGPEGLPIVSKK